MSYRESCLLREHLKIEGTDMVLTRENSVVGVDDPVSRAGMIGWWIEVATGIHMFITCFLKAK